MKNIAKLDELIENVKHHEDETVETAIQMRLQWMAEPGTCNLKMEYEIDQIPNDAHEQKHPIQELAEMIGDPERIIVVQA